MELNEAHGLCLAFRIKLFTSARLLALVAPAALQALDALVLGGFTPAPLFCRSGVGFAVYAFHDFVLSLWIMDMGSTNSTQSTTVHRFMRW
jgi:hypothetical protein